MTQIRVPELGRFVHRIATKDELHKIILKDVLETRPFVKHVTRGELGDLAVYAYTDDIGPPDRWDFLRPYWLPPREVDA